MLKAKRLILIQWVWFSLLLRDLIGFRLSIIGVQWIVNVRTVCFYAQSAFSLAFRVYDMRVYVRIHHKYAHGLRRAPLNCKQDSFILGTGELGLRLFHFLMFYHINCRPKFMLTK